MNHHTDAFLLDGLKTSFFDRHFESPSEYQTRFIFNDPMRGIKVCSIIDDELRNCSGFNISVAFVTQGGITPLLLTLNELEQKGIKGRLLTTDYLYFSEPAALKRLASFSNIEIKMFRCSPEEGFHTKGYLFKQKDTLRILLGSSNLTGPALSLNREWNAHIVCKPEGKFAHHVNDEFEILWNHPNTEPLSVALPSYEPLWKRARRTRAQEPQAIEPSHLEPNHMQQGFIENLEQLFKEGKQKALLISATGTGKTYAAAFAMKRLKPRRVLFLVHREQIAKQALRSFSRVLGSKYQYGLLSGSHKDVHATCLFATMQTMSKTTSLAQYDKEYFDVIIVDEVHRAAADSYRKIMDYFQPKFWLGMTASPDRPDGENIYALFDNNIAYEIRLQTALAENLLCPFHYFGIADIKVNGKSVNEKTSFNDLTSQSRVDHIIEQVERYGYSGDRVKGLIFCSTNAESNTLSRLFNARGYRTLALSGADPQHVRELAIDRLTGDDTPDPLDYIFTVDIFNEGVDIPEVNQVVMLRPTESPIIFIQQLGRGLRKATDKEYVTILDFIGNYKNSFMIPLALSGDNSYDKDTMRRFMSVDRKLIPGASSIHFDQIACQAIYQAIDGAKTNALKHLHDSYKILKNKLGRIPRLLDFEQHNAIDVTKFFNNKGLKSYHAYLRKYEPQYDVKLTPRESEMLDFLCSRIGNAKRISEALLLETALNQPENLRAAFEQALCDATGAVCTDAHFNSTVNLLTNRFERTETERIAKKNCVFLESAGDELRLARGFEDALLSNQEFRRLITELIAFIKTRYRQKYANRYHSTDFVLYEKYTYEDVCRLLNWSRNMTAQNIGGYFYDNESKTLPIFINYHKADDAIGYADRFLTPDTLVALSKTKRHTNSPDADHIYKRNPADKDNKIYLFIRRDKKDDESKAFYFLGEIGAIGQAKPVELPPDGVKAFEITYRLETPVRSDIYDYLTTQDEE